MMVLGNVAFRIRLAVVVITYVNKMMIAIQQLGSMSGFIAMRMCERSHMRIAEKQRTNQNQADEITPHYLLSSMSAASRQTNSH